MKDEEYEEHDHDCPEFNPEHPEDYMKYKHCTDGFAAPIVFPKRPEGDNSTKNNPKAK